MDLLLTLGHNSSAITVQDGKIIRGYEEERLTRKKSDSSFPINAAKLALRGQKPDNIFISHWYDDFNFYKKSPYNETMSRHYNLGFIEDLKANVVSLDVNLTHHDAHAYSAIAFLESHRTAKFWPPFHIIISDGFGNGQEVISIYETDINSGTLSLKNRFFGYENSLGLLYQYATSFCGMKENEDEYKFLGYESHIDEKFKDSQIYYLKDMSEIHAYSLYNKLQITEHEFSKKYIDIKALTLAKESLHEHYKALLDNMPDKRELSIFDKRVAIGFYIQSIIESVYQKMIDEYKMINVLVSGGLHYNVKLNNYIMNHIKGYFCAMPLAGDQGAAIGVYRRKDGPIDVGSLCWGERNLARNVDSDVTVDVISESLLSNKIVNLVTGNMEFGPRALCHTSSLSLAFNENLDYINAVNGRDTVMPMAPVMLERNRDRFFSIDQYAKVIGSDGYMILTYDFKDNLYDSLYNGIRHKYPLSNKYSGRPQVIYDQDSIIYKVLTKLEKYEVYAIVNHSFNIHGTPIVYSSDDALYNFNEQKAAARDKGLGIDRMVLVIS